MKRYAINYIFPLLLFALASCAPATPTLLPIETVFAATHGALMTQTAKAKPPETVTPTSTSTVALTPTPYPSATVVSLTATFTPTATPPYTPTNITSGEGDVFYACELDKLSPGDDYLVKPNEKFKWIWRVRNIGTKAWYPDTMYAKYDSGSSFHTKSRFPVGDPTEVGKIGVFVLQMQAPKKPGTYTTTFSLKKGVHYFCYYSLRIIVRE
ncbi:MAG TPA: hypothetical protein EYP74_04420 [Anaerolineales bacterium]|nr:hypothetical protein [Anaerolineales bacterium]